MHATLHHRIGPDGIEALAIRSDRSFPRHSHDEFGFGYLVAGGQDSWSGRGLVEAGPGDVITVNPAEIHDGRGRPGAPRHWRMLFLAPGALARYGDLRAEAAEWSDPVLSQPATRRVVAGAFAAVAAERPDPGRIEEALLAAIRALAGEAPLEAGPPTGGGPSRPVARVLDLIAQDWGAPLSLSDFAAEAGMSRYAFLRRFSREIGATPHAYLTQHRVKRARAGIAAGLPIAEAALAAGFADQSHLTRAFVRQFGLPPGRFRNAAGR
ncbi:AraC family transcriptional regulator [Poseidonocella sp. HB161398]|uniref:AraC family transcriptional regulator n=1 Tax=Poseidonocella sp. HB161398 TaxID=2320855 RepID=UPI0014862DF9|nr:AraC family transcriptional regulator [Poseidonocella sp. HB161398]